MIMLRWYSAIRKFEICQPVTDRISCRVDYCTEPKWKFLPNPTVVSRNVKSTNFEIISVILVGGDPLGNEKGKNACFDKVFILKISLIDPGTRGLRSNSSWKFGFSIFSGFCSGWIFSVSSIVLSTGRFSLIFSSWYLSIIEKIILVKEYYTTLKEQIVWWQHGCIIDNNLNE